MQELEDQLKALTAEFQNVSDRNLTALQRSRMIGAGTKNYGFINEVSELAAASPFYAQFINIDNLLNSVRNVRRCQKIVVLLKSFSRAVSNTLMVYSTDAYEMSLNYYNAVKSMNRRGDPGAMEIYNALHGYFKRPKRSSAGPTVKQVEKDVHAILTHKKDGKVVVENVSPKTTAGVIKAVDEVHRGKTAAKETDETDIGVK